MATKEKRSGKKTQPRHPEKKWGPFAGGTGVAVWLNDFETEAGTCYARTNVVILVMCRRASNRLFLSSASGDLCHITN